MLNPTASHKQASLYEEICLPHWTYIYRNAYHLSGNRATAEDLTQETFFTAFQKFEQLKDHARARSWLFVILRNLFLGHIEKDKAKLYSDFEDVAYRIEDKSEENERTQREGFSDDVKLPLDKLDEKFKEPLVMAVLGDYSYKEISARLGIPIGTVMSRISRGKSFLKREVEKQLRLNQATEELGLSF